MTLLPLIKTNSTLYGTNVFVMRTIAELPIYISMSTVCRTYPVSIFSADVHSACKPSYITPIVALKMMSRLLNVGRTYRSISASSFNAPMVENPRSPRPGLVLREKIFVNFLPFPPQLLCRILRPMISTISLVMKVLSDATTSAT
jgi:hypothetical protein